MRDGDVEASNLWEILCAMQSCISKSSAGVLLDRPWRELCVTAREKENGSP